MTVSRSATHSHPGSAGRAASASGTRGHLQQLQQVAKQPAPVPGNSQREAADAYLRKHNIPDTLQQILTALLHQRPDDPRKFIIKKLEEAKNSKARGQSLLVFSRENLVALFKVFDVTGKGHITLDQYKAAMTDIGACNYDSMPVGYEKDRIMMDDFVDNARPEIDTLTIRFTELASQMDKIDRAKFRDLLADTFGVDDSLLMDRGTLALHEEANLKNYFHSVFRCFDTDADNYISFDEFMKGMSVFLKGRREERLKFCFRVYDLNGDRYISKEEMFQMLKNCLVKGAEEDEDGVKDLVDLVLKKLDEDRDGRVSETDWNGAIDKESLLMEAFGQCLPTSKVYLGSAMHSINLNFNPKVCQAFIGVREENDDSQTKARQYSPNHLELPAKPITHSGVHMPSKHVHPHAMKGNRRIVVAPAPTAAGNERSSPAKN
ncbi:EF-hand calcium-binding domain-containing protein 1 [Entophlyctis luteolus]|nr:EF-hand calcium-binding domain-containing protein 1 [Entophlyctis luteolus]